MLLSLVAIAAVSVAVYVWTAPMRAERALKTASLQELQDTAPRDPNNPRPFTYLGLRLLQLGQPQQAAKAFRRAADLDGDDEKSWMGAAVAAADSGDLQEGMGIAITFSQRHPNNAAGHFTIAQLCDRQGSLQHAYEEALTSTRLDSHDSDAWRLAGQEALRLGKLPEAEQAFRQAMAQNPRDWRSRIDLGNLLAGRGQNAEASSCFETATRLAPAEALPPLLLGKQLLSRAVTPAEVETARRHLLQSAQIQANNAEVNHQLGISEMRMGKPQAARDYLERAQDFAPADLGIVSDLLTVDKQLNDTRALKQETARQSRLLAYQNAKRLLLDKIKSAPNDSQKLLDLARLCANNGDGLQADRYYRLLSTRAPNVKTVRQEWEAVQRQEAEESPLPVTSPEPTVVSSDATDARILLRDAGDLAAQGHNDAAKSAYLSILARNPRLAAACEGLGRVLNAEGDKEQAASYYERAVRLDPRLPAAQFALAAVDTEWGFYTDAAEHYRQGLAVVPGNAEGWHSLGATLANMSDSYQEAEEAFGRAVTLQPHNTAFVRDLADLQAKRHELEPAEASFRRALALAPQDADTQRELAAFLIANRPTPAALQEAQGLLQSASASAPNDSLNSYWQGRLALLQGDAKRAIALLLRAAPTVQNADAVQLWYSLSRAYVAAGDESRAHAAQVWADRLRARNDLITATRFQLSKSPRNVALRLQLARLYAQSGDLVTATQLYADVRRLDPSNKPAQTEPAKLAAFLKSRRP